MHDPEIQDPFGSNKVSTSFFHKILDKQGVAESNTCAMLPNNESMGKFCLEIGSTYLLATRTAPSATFKQQLQTTNNMYTTTHKIIVFQSSTSRSLKVYEDATKKFLKFVLQIPRLAAAAAALLDTEQTFP